MNDLALALALADIADTEAMGVFRSRTLVIESKPDSTPVTEADRRIEERLRERIGRERPEHAVLGEEFGFSGSTGATWRWVIDPIDGTTGYLRGAETWATLIALQHEGRTQVAVASAAAMRQRYHAVRGEGAQLDHRRIRVSRVSRLEDALIAHTSLRGFVRTGLVDRLIALAGPCWDGRSLGNSLSHLAVARGSADIGWTSRANVWDFAALSLIVEEAGGRFTDRSGDDARLGGSGISSNGLLHQRALAAAGLS